MMDHVIARYGEISLKGNNRGEFERTLLRNLRDALKPWPQVKAERADGRIIATLHGAPETDVLDAMRRVFGIVSVSPVETCAPDLIAVTDIVVRLASEAVTNAGHGLTFKVEAKRVDKRFPLPSPEIASRLGAAVLNAVDGIRVDVHHPDLILYVEFREGAAFVYHQKASAVGGLPVGSSGRVGLLLSGGIDSPVAGWLAMKRGARVEAIHFHSFPFTSERALQKVETLAGILAQWGGRMVLHTVPFTRVQTDIRKHCPDELGITIMRRMMLRIASAIAEQRSWLALVTGESLGQVASQTLESMNVINRATSLPVLRPLVAEDKVDIMARARAIGTFETSILPYEDCCTIFVPKNPRTRPRLAEVEAAETGLDIEELVRDAVQGTEMKTFAAGLGD